MIESAPTHVHGRRQAGSTSDGRWDRRLLEAEPPSSQFARVRAFSRSSLGAWPPAAVRAVAILLVCVWAAMLPTRTHSADITLAWDPSPSGEARGYRLWYGPSSRQYTHTLNVGDQTTHTLADLDEDSTYFFAVTAYDSLGRESDFSQELAPSTISLFQNYPNPFNPDTYISFGVLSRTPVKVHIYNMLGQLILKLPTGDGYAPGVHSVPWDGRDNKGRPVSSGVYLYRLITSTGTTTTRRMMLLR